MNSLQLFNDKNAIANLPVKDKEIAVALQSRMFKDLSDKEAFELMHKNITRSYMLTRFSTPDATEMQVIVDATMREFKNTLGNIREKEIEIIFSRGIAGEYGEFMGLSFPTFVNFGKSYLREISRIKLTSQVEPTNEPTKEQKFNTAKDLCLKSINKFLQGSSIETEGATVYRFLTKLGLISYSEEEQKEFMQEAEKYIVAQKTAKRSASTDKYIRQRIQSELNNKELLQDSIIRIAQVNGLLSYFQSIEMEQDEPIIFLENEITEKAKKYL